MNEEIKIITLGDIFKNLETEEKAFKLKDYIISLQQELDQYKNNRKELKKCINHYAIDEEDGSKIYSVEEIELLEILDKMKELEEGK